MRLSVPFIDFTETLMPLCFARRNEINKVNEYKTSTMASLATSDDILSSTAFDCPSFQNIRDDEIICASTTYCFENNEFVGAPLVNMIKNDRLPKYFQGTIFNSHNPVLKLVYDLKIFNSWNISWRLLPRKSKLWSL